MDTFKKSGYKELIPLKADVHEMETPSGFVQLHIGVGCDLSHGHDFRVREPEDSGEYFEALISMYINGAITEKSLKKECIAHGFWIMGHRTAKKEFNQKVLG